MKTISAILSTTLGIAAVLLLNVSARPARAQQAETPRLPEIVAHRGASYDAPENTVASAKLGWEQWADAVEIDIYLSKDGRIVVMHDATTKRTAGVDRKIAEQTFEELRALDAGAWKGARFAGEKIPTLDEIIETIPSGKRLVIEIKCGPEVIPALTDSLKRSGKPDSAFLIIAFSHPTIKQVKQALPGIEAYWLSSFRKDPQTGVFTPDAAELIRKAKDAGVEGVNLNHTGPVDAALVKQIKDAGLKCYVWTVDSAEAARRLQAAGVDGITTNRPAWMREQLAGRP